MVIPSVFVALSSGFFSPIFSDVSFLLGWGPYRVRDCGDVMLLPSVYSSICAIVWVFLCRSWLWSLYSLFFPQCKAPLFFNSNNTFISNCSFSKRFPVTYCCAFVDRTTRRPAATTKGSATSLFLGMRRVACAGRVMVVQHGHPFSL